MSRQIFQLRVTLSEVTPEVWRRVLVPGGYTLDRVHRVIQYAMGWEGYHLHSFDIGDVSYGVPDPDGPLETRDELDVRLDAAVGKGARFLYVYDFGDWWEHEVQVEDIFVADPDESYPLCADGGSACPPEDVGGPAGYRSMLEALADPEHPRHDQMTEWLGRRFDPTAFDPTRATTLIRRFC